MKYKQFFGAAVLLLAAVGTAHAQTKDLSSSGVLLDRVAAVVNDGLVLRSDVEKQMSVISARIQRMQASTATMLFIVYSALNGATLSSVFLAYTQSSITSTFFICAATFTACSVYGWTTRRDLTTMGGFLTMGLIGIVIASVVNMFFQSGAVSTIVSYVGVLVFVGLTAYDTQDIKNMALSQPADIDAGAVRKGAILGALKLYLDFINLFLMLLRIFGGRRD